MLRRPKTRVYISVFGMEGSAVSRVKLGDKHCLGDVGFIWVVIGFNLLVVLVFYGLEMKRTHWIKIFVANEISLGFGN